jgi:hypothetical protein
LIRTPGRWRVAGVNFGFITGKTTGRPGRNEGDLDAWQRELDPGVSHYVKVLYEHGVETFESCEGGQGHCFPVPTIRFHGERDEGFRALAIALQRSLPVADLRRVWSIEDREPVGPAWELTFWRKATSLVR